MKDMFYDVLCWKWYFGTLSVSRSLWVLSTPNCLNSRSFETQDRARAIAVSGWDNWREASACPWLGISIERVGSCEFWNHDEWYRKRKRLLNSVQHAEDVSRILYDGCLLFVEFSKLSEREESTGFLWNSAIHPKSSGCNFIPGCYYLYFVCDMILKMRIWLPDSFSDLLPPLFVTKDWRTLTEICKIYSTTLQISEIRWIIMLVVVKS